VTKLVRITTVPISLEKLIEGQMRFMKSQGFDVYMVSSEYEHAARLEEKENCPYIAVNMTRAISPVKDLASLFKMIRVLRQLKPQIVHTHTPKAGLIGMMASWFVSVPVRLHTVAGLPLMETQGMKRKLLVWVEKLTYAFAGTVYPNSTNLYKFILKNRFCKPNKLKIIGNGSSNGINTEYFKPNPTITGRAEQIKKEYSLKGDEFVYVFVGRLVKDKGIEELIKAFSAISPKYPQLRLLLVGPLEPERDPLSAECLQEITDNKAIITTGYQGDVRPYLAMSDALVFPSYREGFPNVPLQAACFHLPSIVTDINGCNEIIEDEVNGLMIPVKNTGALQQAMERLIDDTALYQKLKTNARAMVVERFEQKHLWALILEEYRNQLQQHEIVS
jgi:glycosyltransferase involved in cell wall biosynthesis